MAGLFDDVLRPSSRAYSSGLFDDVLMEEPAPAPAPSRNIAAVANDWVIEAANAIAQTAGAVSEFVSPGNRFAQGVEEFVRKGEESQSDVAKQSKERFRSEMEAAQGFGEEAAAVGRYFIDSPGLVASQALGSVAAPGGFVRGASGLVGGAARSRALASGATPAQAAAAGTRAGITAGTTAGVAIGGAAAGGDAAGNAYDLVMRAPLEVISQSPQWKEIESQGEMSPDQIREALATSAARDASVLPAIVGGVAGAFGLERLLAGPGRATTRLGQAGRTGLTEGVQEGFEEGITQYEGRRAAALLDPSIDPMKGVGGAATMGAALGATSGGLIGAAMGPQPAPAPPPPPAPSGVDAQLDRSLDQLQRARDEVYLGGQSPAETIAQVVSAPDLSTAIEAAEASVPSMQQLMQEKRLAAAKVVADQLGIAPATNFPTIEQALTDSTAGLAPGETRVLTQPSVFAEPPAGTPGLQPGETRVLTQPSVFAEPSAGTPGLQPGETGTVAPPAGTADQARLANARAAVDRDAQLLAQRDGTSPARPPAQMLLDAQRMEESARLIESNPRAPEAVLQRAQALREQAQALRARAEDIAAAGPAARPGAMTEFDRGNIDAQRQINLESRRSARGEGQASDYADLAPMDARTAQGRLKALRDQIANEGGDALSLQVVPHPNTPGRFAISKAAEVPSLDMPAAPRPEVGADQAQYQIESAELTGREQRRKRLDEARQIVVTRALKNVEERGGVASPQEAQIFQEAGLGKPYDSINESLAPSPGLVLPKMELSGPATTGAGVVTESGEVRGSKRANRGFGVNAAMDFTPTGLQATTSPGAAPARQPGIEPGAPLGLARPQDKAPTDTSGLSLVPIPTAEQEASDARMQQLAVQRQTRQDEQDQANQKAGARQTPPPSPDVVVAALRKPAFQRTADEKQVIRQATQLYSSAQMAVLMRATAPATMSASDKLQLRQMREAQSTKLSEQRAGAGAEATQQGRPVSTLGNITTVDPATLQTQSKADSGTISKQTHRMISLIASMFGKKVVLFSSDNPNAPDGFVREGDSRTINLNVKSQISHLVVFGHELLHQLKADNPQAYEALLKVIRLNEDADTNVPGIRGDMEELTGDVVGNRFREPEFWSDVFRQIIADTPGAKGKELVTRLGASVVRTVNRMVKALRGAAGFDTDKMVANLEEVKEAVTKALASYAQEKRGEATELIRQEAAGRQGAEVETAGEIKTSAGRAATIANQQGTRDGRPEQAGDRAGRYSSGSLAPLEGAPNVAGASGPDPRLVAVAEEYAREAGIALRRQSAYVQVDEDRARRISEAYDAMPHAPQDPAVREAYQNLIDQTRAQYDALARAGYEFTFFDSASDPYGGNPWNAMRDLRANKRMAVYGTYDGYGTEGITQGAVEDNPMLADTGLRWKDQAGVERPVLANDLFRAVHDAFGHGLEGAGFRAQGEENAWQAHVRLFTGSAVGAITSETRGQNSWLNYGPYGERNRNAKVEDTVFADQKTGLMPEWTWSEGRAEDEIKESAKRVLDSPEFKRWFGDSKVVDENGNPLVVYHGTAEDVDAFDPRRIGANFGEDTASAGFYFIASPKAASQYAESNSNLFKVYPRMSKGYRKLLAEEYGFVNTGYYSSGNGPTKNPNVMPVYLSLQNPLIKNAIVRKSADQSIDFMVDKWKQEAIEGGHDGLIIRATGGYKDRGDVYVAFRPEQIKSATGNVGTYDPANPDIRKSEKRILLNIGLSTQEVKGGGLLTEDVVRSAIRKLMRRVDSLVVLPSDTEPTAVVAIDKPLSAAEGDKLSTMLNQEAIVQRMPDGSGELFGPQAANWGPYNPEYFLMQDGRRAVDLMAPASEEGIKESAKRRKTQEAGTEVPTSVDRAADSTAAFKRARGKVFETNRELKTEIQDAVRAAAEDAGVDLSVFSEETEKYLVRIATAEAVKALRENANAIGWYREKVTKALRIAALKHPELNTDPESRMVFIWGLAVTSNGMRVKKNFELADKAYSSWKRYGKFPTKIGQGTAKKAINNGLRAYNVLSKKMTFDQLRDAMLTKSSVAQIGKLLGIKPSGEYADTIVYGSAILGPKVGNGFFANLYGHYEQLTIDRWLMRTWGRWTGTLVEVKTDVVSEKADKLSALLDMLTDEQRTQLEQAIGRTVYLDDLEPTAAAISAATVKESVRDALDEIGPLDKDMRARLVEVLGKEKANSKRVSLGDEIRKAGIGLNQAIDGQVEAPRDPQQRNDMRKVFEQVLAELQKTNPGLTMSDLQAVLWYPEKRIYDAAKTDKETNDGYEDGAAPDYANAAAEHYRGRGVAKSAIDRVIAEVDSELQAADGAGRGGRGAGGVAEQPGSAGVKASDKRDTDSPGFKRWFGDSKLVDENGEPLTLYHGTQADSIRVFKRSEDGALGPGIYLTESMEAAGSYAGEGGTVEMLYARMERPLIVYTGKDEAALQIARDDKFWKENFFTRAAARKWAQDQLENWAGIQDPEFPQMLKDAGYDGVILKNPETGEIVEAMVPSANQVKSNLNDGEWSRSNPDIYASEKRASWTDDRINDLLDAYAYTMNDAKTKAYAGWVSPADYLAATTPADEAARLETERKPLDVAELAGERQPIMIFGELSADRTWKSDGHEGRHRMMALRDAGVRSVPVVFKMSQGAEAEITTGVYVTPQRWGDTRAQKGFLVGLTPISYKFKAEIERKFGRDGDIRFSEKRNIFGDTVQPSWTSAAATPSDNWIYYLQDKGVDLKRTIEQITAAGGAIDDKVNARVKEELYHGKAAKQTKDFINNELNPLLDNMRRAGVSIQEFETYLHNRHAEERNNQIAKINKRFPDGGSGINTADARAYLAGLDPDKKRVYQDLAKQADAISRGTRRLLVRSGLETQETIDAWDNAYGAYVPLFREEGDYTGGGAPGTGQGFDVRGASSRRATGSDRPVVDILANLAMQRERTIARAEKAVVGRALYGLAIQNPNPGFWMAVDPQAVDNPLQAAEDLDAMGLDPADLEALMQEPKQAVVNPKTGAVSYRPTPALRNGDNVLAVRIDGRDRYIFFARNDPRASRMAKSMKGLDANQMGAVLSAAGAYSRFFAQVNTQFNPIFGAINVIRDFGSAAFNLTTTAIADRKAQVLSGVPGAALGIYSAIRAQRKGRKPQNNQWSGLWDQFQRDGGQTGFRDMFTDSNDRAKALQRALDPSSWADSPLGRVFTANGTLKAPLEVARKTAAPLFNWLSDYNETLENAVRLSAYKAALDKGLSRDQAASIAKNLTVNFNRKGEVGQQAGALYAFFNASVQGTARMYETMKGPAGKKILGGGLLLGAMQALALAAVGFDEDEPPDWVKERNLVLPTINGKYITIPMPLGLNVIPNAGRVATEWVLSGFKDTPRRVAQITGSMLDMFNPIGNAGWSVQTFTPTFLDPATALSENRDWQGRPIAKEDRSSTNPTPGFTRARDTASWLSNQLAYALNIASGGTDYKKGVFSPTPDQIDYLIGQVTGGVGRELIKFQQLAQASVTGEDLPTYKIPVVGRVLGDTKEQSNISSRFYANLTRINEHENEIKGRVKDRVGGVREYLAKNPEARLIQRANQVERDVSQLRRRKRDLVDRGASKESIKLIEQQITRRMQTLNNQVEALTQ